MNIFYQIINSHKLGLQNRINVEGYINHEEDSKESSIYDDYV